MADFLKSLIANDLKTPSIIFTLFLGFLLSAIIGFERSQKQQIAGLRTHILIGLGSVIFTLVSRYMHKLYPTADASRIAAQVVSGIGFISVGAIIKLGFTVKGVTTVASIWCTASIGLATGAGMYSLAGFATILSLFTLIIVDKLYKKHFSKKHHRYIIVKGKNTKKLPKEIYQILSDRDIKIKNISIEESKTKIELRYFVEIDTEENVKSLADAIEKIAGVDTVEVE